MVGTSEEVLRADTGVLGVAHGGDAAGEGEVDDLIGADAGGDVAGDCLRNTGLSPVNELPAPLGGEVLVIGGLSFGLNGVEAALESDIGLESDLTTEGVVLLVLLLPGMGDTFRGSSLARPCNATGVGLDTCCSIGLVPALVLAS